jgi:5S rRNA maturation endonuclease (ribonuclease M5)
MISFEPVKDALRSRGLVKVLAEWFPRGHIVGREFCVGNLAGDPGDSLKFNLDKGCGQDFATGVVFRDEIDLYAQRHRINLGEACDRLAAQYAHTSGNGAKPNRAERRRQAKKVAAIYAYRCLENVRFDPKAFRQRHPCGLCGGRGCGECRQGYHWNLGGVDPNTGESRCPCHPDGVELSLYHEDRILESGKPADDKPPRGVLIPEGERDVETLERLGFIATTNPMGAGKWRPEFNESLRGRRVAIFADNDAAGLAHARNVAANLVGIATDVTLVERLPGMGNKDVTEYIDSLEAEGCDPEQVRVECHAAINAIIAATPLFTAKDAAKVKAEPDSVSKPLASGPYRVAKNGATVRVTEDGEEKVIATFSAHVASEIRRDDGERTTLHFEIEAAVDGSTKTAVVPAKEFSSMAWVVGEFGAGAIVLPPRSNLDQLRAAIQFQSRGRTIKREVYTHTGWRKIDGRNLYLHGDGAIGEDGFIDRVIVELPTKLGPFRLPPPPTGPDLIDAVRASLHLLDLAPGRLTAAPFAQSGEP